MNYKYECIFLDRDGTINIDPGYISNVKDFKFYDYTFKALRLLSSLAKSFIIITNQSGVSRGLIKKEELAKINKYIFKKFLENKLNLLNIYYCIDAPESSSEFRKPDVGMFLQASRKHSIDLARCIMIGDSFKDIVPAKKLGMSSLLVLTGNGRLDIDKFDQSFQTDYISENLYSGAKELIK